MRYYVGLFLLVWLGLWFAGFSSAVSSLSSGQPHAFLVFWLVGWTLGGAYAMYIAYRALRPRAGVADADAEQRGIRLRDSPASAQFRLHHKACLEIHVSQEDARGEIEREWLYQLLAIPYSLPLGDGERARRLWVWISVVDWKWPQRRKTMSARMSAIGVLSGLVLLTLSFVGHDPQRSAGKGGGG